MSRQVTTLEQALFCAKCSSRATLMEEHCGSNFSTGEILLIKCPISGCREKPWFFCKSCSTRCYQNGLARHATRKKHRENNAIAYPRQAQQENPEPLAPDQDQLGNDDERVMQETARDNEMEASNSINEIIMLEPEQSADNTKDDAMDICESMEATESFAPLCYFPKLKMEGNEWLAEVLKDTKLATRDEVLAAFSKPELEHMRNFYVSELASGEGRCGGGVMYLAARAFQQVKDSQLDEKRFPDYGEAKWQMNNLIQYQSMNEKQRQRQASLNQALMAFIPKNLFFKETYLPPYNHLGRYYGSSGQHSMYNNLPCPRARDVDGVAYTSPTAIIAFVMANGIPIDDIVVRPESKYDGPDHLRRVLNVEDCQKAVDWYRSIQRDYYGSETGAPNSNFGAPKHEAVVCLHLSDWTDGFDSAKVKSNRNAIDSKTFTVSPPKHLANATDNTFAVALGLKKAKGWKKVEEMFREEVEALTNSREPILFYHGTTQKMVPCFLKRFAVLSDKAERNGLTGTLGCGSDIHRCFGVSGKIQTPSCNVAELQDFLKNERNGTETCDYGWSNKFICETTGNGAVYPSCLGCRKRGLLILLGQRDNNQSSCPKCHNWDLIGPEKEDPLKFPAHKDYPRFSTDGSPVLAPEGRDVFEKDVELPFVKLGWKLMIQACKFAFYQASRPKQAWTKANTVCYLKHCGVSTNLAELLHSVAKQACKSKEQDTVDYNRPNEVGKFRFDPAWLSGEIAVQDFIEAVMHQLFLGAAESNYELITIWLSSTPPAAKLGHSSFLAILQVLIKDLRGFNLSWLLAYPLTGKKGKLGTGSWVAENWVFFVRISQFIFGWCSRDSDIASKYGVEDMSRVVISFHAFVSRCLTHAGITGESIQETELYLKEFLSALREFDVRVRHEKLNKPTAKVSERKGTEAWWLKPNYMSLCNLVSMLWVIGPLVLWWDGGGRGERFIQVVKPHIKRGVRDDVLSFFVTLLEKLFRVRILHLFEDRFDLAQDNHPVDSEEDNMLDILNEIAELILPDDEDDSSVDSSDDEADDDAAPEVRYDEAYFSTNETHGMTKNKAFYVYRNENTLNEAIANNKPITGIVELDTSVDGETAFEFQVIFRKPVKQFARRKVVFKDNEGISFHGMWCAPITVEEEDDKIPPTTDFKYLQGIAKLSAVAIPLWYVIGKNQPNSDKYCVITNWWKYRMQDGAYRLPVLDPKMYKAASNNFDMETLLREASRRNRGGRGATITGVI